MTGLSATRRRRAGAEPIDRPRREFAGRCGAACAAVAASSLALAREGVEVGATSPFARVVPAEQIERAAALQYERTIQAARQQGVRARDDHPQLVRLRAIARRIIPYAEAWNPRARGWRWEVNLIGSQQVNAFCMPGGKIAFYWGILDRLQLVDDEVAMVMGHEAAHALREHAREQLGKRFATRAAVEVGAAVFGWRNAGRLLADMGAYLASMKFSRDDESEADLIGLELAARAGYDPRAGVSLWQKMAVASRRGPIELISTHPSGPNRIADIERNLPKVDPIYLRAEKPPERFKPPEPRDAPPRGRS